MLKGYLFILLAATCWGFIGIFASVSFAEGLGPMEVAFWRAVIAWIVGAIPIARVRTTPNCGWLPPGRQDRRSRLNIHTDRIQTDAFSVN